MANVMNGFINTIHYLFTTDFSDPRTRNWFWSGSIVPPLLVICSYQYFVRSLGPQLMKNRKPYNLELILKVYNIFQVCFSLFIVYKAWRVCYIDGNYSLLCQAIKHDNSVQSMKEVEVVWYYYMAKITDLLDTVFFILRKKFKQASFLHVYHHSGMIVTGLMGTRYACGGHAVSLGAINSFIHAIMYFYYFLSSVDKKYTEAKWKKYITQLQMIQFVCLIVHFSLPFIYQCGYPLWPCAVIVPQYLFMLALFYDFYSKAYENKPKQS